MSAADRLEAFADAAALTRAIHEHDAEARRVVLAGADQEAVCEALARILHAVVRTRNGGCERCADGFLATWQSEIRIALAELAEE